jgi:hypothetical protein
MPVTNPSTPEMTLPTGVELQPNLNLPRQPLQFPKIQQSDAQPKPTEQYVGPDALGAQTRNLELLNQKLAGLRNAPRVDTLKFIDRLKKGAPKLSRGFNPLLRSLQDISAIDDVQTVTEPSAQVSSKDETKIFNKAEAAVKNGNPFEAQELLNPGFSKVDVSDAAA